MSVLPFVLDKLLLETIRLPKSLLRLTIASSQESWKFPDLQLAIYFIRIRSDRNSIFLITVSVKILFFIPGCDYGMAGAALSYGWKIR